MDHERKPLLFSGEAPIQARLEHRGDAVEQRPVVENLIPEGGQLRRRLPLHGAHGGVIHRRGVDAKKTGDAPPFRARLLQCLQGVGERGRRGIGGDARDLRAIADHCFFQRRSEQV